MGIDWPEEEFGVNCMCWPPGRTPKYLYAAFTDIVKCHPPAGALAPPNRSFVLTQVPAQPCQWIYVDADWYVAYFVFAGQSFLYAQSVVYVVFAFHSVANLPCQFVFANQNICSALPGPPVWGGGLGMVFSRGNEPLPSFQDFAALCNLIADDKAKCEFWPVSDRQVMLRYARQQSPTNILMKIDWTEYDQYDMFEW